MKKKSPLFPYEEGRGLFYLCREIYIIRNKGAIDKDFLWFANVEIWFSIFNLKIVRGCLNDIRSSGLAIKFLSEPGIYFATRLVDDIKLWIETVGDEREIAVVSNSDSASG